MLSLVVSQPLSSTTLGNTKDSTPATKNRMHQKTIRIEKSPRQQVFA